MLTNAPAASSRLDIPKPQAFLLFITRTLFDHCALWTNRDAKGSFWSKVPTKEQKEGTPEHLRTLCCFSTSMVSYQDMPSLHYSLPEKPTVDFKVKA